MKGYVVCVYKNISNYEKLKEYALKARAAVEKYNGSFSQVKDSVTPKIWWVSKQRLTLQDCSKEQLNYKGEGLDLFSMNKIIQYKDTDRRREMWRSYLRRE